MVISQLDFYAVSRNNHFKAGFWNVPRSYLDKSRRERMMWNDVYWAKKKNNKNKNKQQRNIGPPSNDGGSPLVNQKF